MKINVVVGYLTRHSIMWIYMVQAKTCFRHENEMEECQTRCRIVLKKKKTYFLINKSQFFKEKKKNLESEHKKKSYARKRLRSNWWQAIPLDKTQRSLKNYKERVLCTERQRLKSSMELLLVKPHVQDQKKVRPNHKRTNLNKDLFFLKLDN